MKVRILLLILSLMYVMKQIIVYISGLLPVILIGIFFLLWCLPAFAQNLIQNPGFELGSTTPSNWINGSQGGPNPPGVTFTWESGVAHGGTRSISINSTGIYSGISFWRQQLSISAATVYTLSVWIKGDTIDKHYKVVVRFLNGTTMVGQPSEWRGTLNTFDWTQTTFAFISPQGVNQIDVQLCNNGSGAVYYDDVSFTAGNSSAQVPLRLNLVSHFEELSQYINSGSGGFSDTANQVQQIATACSTYNMKYSWQIDWTLIEGAKINQSDFWANIETQGHEITTHVHESVYSGHEVTVLLEDIGIINNHDGNGHFLAPEWTKYWANQCALPHVSNYKNVYTQTANNRYNPWRPQIGNDNYYWLTHDPAAPAVYIPQGLVSGSWIDQSSANTMTTTLNTAMAVADQQRVNTANCFTSQYFTNFPSSLTTQQNWLGSIGSALINAGLISSVNMHDAYQYFTAWETANPGLPPVTDGLTTDPGDTTVYTFPPGWNCYTQTGDGNAGIPALTNNWQVAVTKDSNNTIWSGTMGGINYYDGTWHAVTESNGLPRNYIHCLIPDPQQGGVWAGTDDGGVAYVNSSGTVQTIYNVSNTSGGMTSNFVHVLLLDSHGNLWVGTFHGGISKRAPSGTWTHYSASNSALPDNDVFAIAEAPSGDIYLGTSGGGVAFIDSAGMIYPLPAITSYEKSRYVHALLFDSNGSLWAGTHGSGIARWNGSEWAVFKADTNENADSNIIMPHGLRLDTNNRLLVATMSAHIHRFTPTTQTWELNYLTIPPNGIFTNLPKSFLYSYCEGTWWVGTQRGLKINTANSPAVPAEITDLHITKSGTNLIFLWSPVTVDTNGNPIVIGQYNLYGNSNPNYIPSPATYIGSTPYSTWYYPIPSVTIIYYQLIPIC